MQVRHQLMSAVVLSASACAAFADPTFQGIGVAPGMLFSRVSAISADGSTVVGSSWRPGSVPPVYAGPVHLIRWRTGALEDLGDAGTLDCLEPAGVNFDGSVIAATGYSTSGGRPTAFRWTEPDGTQPLAVPGRASLGGPVSADGGRIVGSYSAGGAPPFGTYLWTLAQGATPLPAEVRNISDMSPDGSILVGHDSGQAFLWTQDGGIESMGPVPGGWTGSLPRAISDDTHVVIGVLERGVAPIDITPYRWMRGGGYELLAAGPADAHATALACSADGALVVGQMWLGAWTAVIWSADGSYRTVADYLGESGISTAGWVLTDANSISADGRTIAGNGHRIGGGEEGWVATIPAPGATALLGLGLLAVRRRRG